MIRVAVHGATGRMGGLVTEVLAGRQDTRLVATPTRDQPDLGDAEVVVDFSTPDALEALLPRLDGRGLVSGTTGLYPSVEGSLEAAARTSPVLHAPNFSIGVAVLLGLAEAVGRRLPTWDVEIVETHHAGKRDAPSGTALALRDAVRPGAASCVGRHGRHAGEVGLHAMRLGDVVGEHDVWLAGPGERLRLGHVATSRRAFAEGAVAAAVWVTGRAPGRYRFAEVVGW